MTQNTRIEKDLIGELEVPKESYYGIHTQRALNNFEVSGYRIPDEFIKSFGLVKLAAIQAITDLNIWEKDKASAIQSAAQELADGKLSEHILVDAMQGGAGTSLNMNINEVIANRALEILEEPKGTYEIISPIDDINKFQSTNDVFPTALKVACIQLLRELEKQTTSLQEAFEAKEKEFADIVKVGRTQLNDAVLTTLGKEFSAYAEPISRDRWRIYKCEERLRVVNLGGTAIGTGLGANRKYIFAAVDKLRTLTDIGLSRAENLVENTQNTDVFAEVSGILKAHAVNLIKISNDLRLMGSDVLKEIHLPEVQAGSSIMAGKINPVIPEMVAQIGTKVLGNDVIINQACAGGNLELNQNMPLIAFSMIESLKMLCKANAIFVDKCINGIEANKQEINSRIKKSPATLMAFLSKLSYEQIQEIKNNSDGNYIQYIIEQNILTQDEIDFTLSPEAVLALGHR